MSPAELRTLRRLDSSKARKGESRMTLLDTSSLVHLLRRQGDPAVKQRVNSILLRGDAAICDMVEVELWMGVASKEDEKDVVDLSALLVSVCWKNCAEPALPSGAEIGGTTLWAADLPRRLLKYSEEAARQLEFCHTLQSMTEEKIGRHLSKRFALESQTEVFQQSPRPC